jgi:hypothetical protein
MVLSLSKHEAAPYCEPPLLTGGEKRAISDMPSHSARRLNNAFENFSIVGDFRSRLTFSHRLKVLTPLIPHAAPGGRRKTLQTNRKDHIFV